jgi:PAS domain S-box-containing protein
MEHSSQLPDRVEPLDCAEAGQQCHDLFEQAPTPIAVVRGRELRYALANPAYHEMVGTPPLTIVGRTVGEVLPDLAPECSDAMHEALRTGETIRLRCVQASPGRSAREHTWWDLEHVPLVGAGGGIDGVAIMGREVTDQVLARQRLEAAVREAEQRAQEAEDARRTLDALMEYIPEGITIAEGPDVHIRRVSRFGREITGRAAEAIEGIPATADEHARNWGLYHVDAVTPATDAELPLTRAVRQAQVITDEEWILRRPDGTDVTILCNAGPIRGAGDEVLGGVIAWRDITGRKAVEAALLESEERFRSLAELSPDAILVAAGGRYLYANAAAARMLGAGQVHELLGRDPLDFVAPGFRDLARERIRHVLEARLPVSPVEARWVRLGGASVDVEVVASPVSWSGEPGIQIVARDITERKRIEAALQRDREFLQRLIDAIPVLVTVYDPELRQIIVNREFERVLGWTSDDLSRVDVMEVCYPDPEYREQVRMHMQRPGDRWQDIRITTRSGTTLETAWANIRLTDDRQVGIGVDISERKQSEREIRRAYDDAKRALKERDSVMAVVSHDLRNPLSTIAMASSLLLEAIPEEKKQSQAAIIRRAVDQMARLIDDLLDAARIEGGALRIIEEPCRVDELIRAAAEFYGPLAEARSVTLQANPATRVSVMADRTRILQVFANLIANAIHHTPEGGRIVLSCVVGEHDVCFQVRDTGSGIAPEDRPYVFDRFWQAERSGSGGAGLGLAIAKGIVEAHGGRIWVDSDATPGSTFAFVLPISR